MVLCADARALPLRDGCVDCVVTSPPYWGLRDYGTAQWLGGNAECSHFKLAGGTGAQNLGKLATASAANVERSSVPYRDACGKCGAERVDAQLGLERTPEAYVAGIVAVCRELARVLTPTGTLWLNLGDSYNSTEIGRHDALDGPKWAGRERQYRKPIPTLLPKNLVGIPWRVAFALQADGWYLRADIIWAKPNPMPESVTDRPTKAHEYLFLLTKRERYYYDADAIREDNSLDMQRRAEAGHTRGANGKLDASRQDALTLRGPQSMAILADGRNKRSVWTIPTMPYAGAHFATFPEALVEPCILAGCPLGGLVLDPFLGSGTVGAVAERLSRRWVGTDLAYHDLATERTAQRGFRFEWAEAVS